MPVPPLVSVQAFLRVLAWAGHSRVGPWASALGRWVAGKEVGPFAGRRRRGQLCRVGASSPALCSVRAWSQTAPLFSCWDCWEVGRPDWGAWAGGRDTRCQGLTGLVPVPVHIRPRIKVELGAGPRGVRLPGGGILVGSGWHLGTHLHSHVALEWAGGPLERDSTSHAPLLLPGLARVPAPVPCVLLTLCFRPSAQPPPRSARVSGPLPSAQASLPPFPGLYLLALQLSLFFPTVSTPSLPPCLSPAALVASSASLGSISHLCPAPYTSACPVLVSTSLCPWGPCAWVGMGVSLEKSLLASPLQLRAGCHGNRVSGGAPTATAELWAGGGAETGGPVCSPVSPEPEGSQSPRGGLTPTGWWSPDSDLSFPEAQAGTPAPVSFTQPSPFHHLLLVPEIRLFVVTPPPAPSWPQAQTLALLHPLQASRLRSSGLRPPSVWGAGEGALGCVEAGRRVRRRPVPGCVPCP